PARRAMESSRWAACFEAHPPENRPHMVRARMGAGSNLQGIWSLHQNLADEHFQRPSGRERKTSVRWYAQSGKPPATLRRPSGRKPTFPQQSLRRLKNQSCCSLETMPG
ncbi:MAG TPA: hypothetical protein PKZ53_26865, partial [Acidobacteriota bacterium]|nr:hypothetical protein [Acidobacteriota bacterium]